MTCGKLKICFRRKRPNKRWQRCSFDRQLRSVMVGDSEYGSILSSKGQCQHSTALFDSRDSFLKRDPRRDINIPRAQTSAELAVLFCCACIIATELRLGRVYPIRTRCSEAAHHTDSPANREGHVDFLGPGKPSVGQFMSSVVKSCCLLTCHIVDVHEECKIDLRRTCLFASQRVKENVIRDLQK